jgi:hypothetical protein
VKLYEIVNPSDPVTFEAPSDEVAAAAVLSLGEGFYGCQGEDDRRVLPILAFFSGAFEPWAKENPSVMAVLSAEPGSEAALAVAAALESTAVCSLENRAALVAAVGRDPGAVDRWNEARRSSLNNICRAARKLAGRIRAAKPEAAS